MFVLPGLAALVILIFLKPQEFVPGLEGLPLLYVFLGLTVFGLLVDLKLGFSRFDPPPQWPYVAAFVPWCLFTQVANIGGPRIVNTTIDLAIIVVLFLALSLGTRSFRGFEVVAGALLFASMFVALVCFNQGFSPLACAVQQGEELETLRSDGRPCNNEEDCLSGDAEPGAVYRCEREGVFGTVSVGRGRVRYRGVLKDPNEVALAIGAAFPLLVARVSRKRSVGNITQLVALAIVIGVTIVFTQSRGGILVFLAVLGVYAIKQYGIKGAAIGGMLGLPLLLLGGRSGDEAQASADERTEALVEGLNMLRSNPLYGVGQSQFTEHHTLTAHNSYLLALAELGIPGFILFAFILYLSIKIPLQAMRRYRGNADAQVANTWSLAIFASFCGVAVGSFFLSFTYHQVLWIYFGVAGALYGAIRRHDPTFVVKTSLLEKSLIVVTSVVFPVTLRLFLLSKGH
jgi:O-antigen ligase